MTDETTARHCTACGAVSEEELNRIDWAASRRNLTRSQFVRNACLIATTLIARPEAGRQVHEVLTGTEERKVARSEEEA